MTVPVRVLLVEDHPMFRAGLEAALKLYKDVDVVGSVGTADDAAALLAAERPDVVVLDIGLPDGNGVSMLPRIHAELPGCRVLMLTSYDDDSTVYGALRAGARGYVVKTADADEIVRAVRTVASGAGHFSPTVVDRITEHVATGGRSSDATAFPELTRREREILALIAQGHSNTYRRLLRPEPQDRPQPRLECPGQARRRFASGGDRQGPRRRPRVVTSRWQSPAPGP